MQIRYLIDLIKPDGSEETSAEILAEIDANHDGHVSFEEFIEVWHCFCIELSLMRGSVHCWR